MKLTIPAPSEAILTNDIQYYSDTVSIESLCIGSENPQINLSIHSSPERLFEAFTLSFEIHKLSEMTIDQLKETSLLVKKVLDVLH